MNIQPEYEGASAPPSVPEIRDIPAVKLDDAFAGDGAFRQLAPEHVQAEQFSARIFEVVLLVPQAIFLIWVWLGLDPALWLKAALTLLPIGLMALLRFNSTRWPRLAYEATSYAVSPVGMVIKRGVLWKHTEHIPRSRVQHTDVRQGPIERRYGLGTIVLYTAGTHNATTALSGLRHETASLIRDYMIRREGAS